MSSWSRATQSTYKDSIDGGFFMKRIILTVLSLGLLIQAPAWALDPVAPRAERKYGMIYVKTPNANDTITLTSLRDESKTQTLSPEEDVKIKVGDYRVSVVIQGGYSYEQDVIVRATERHEVIVPGFGNVRVNGQCATVTILQGGKKVAEIKCNEVRTLPRGPYDLEIKKGKFTLKQSITVVTNTLRELDVR